MIEGKLNELKDRLEKIWPKTKSVVLLTIDYEGIATVQAQANLIEMSYMKDTLDSFLKETMAGRIKNEN